VVDHEAKEVRTTVTGPVLMEDIQDHMVQEGEEGGLAYRELVDASRAVPLMTTTDARATVEILKTMALQGMLGPTAVIVPNEVGYGLVRMVEILLDGVAEVRPFRKEEAAEAREWLNGESR
jgi:hypothetical protein